MWSCLYPKVNTFKYFKYYFNCLHAKVNSLVVHLMSKLWHRKASFLHGSWSYFFTHYMTYFPRSRPNTIATTATRPTVKRLKAFDSGDRLSEMWFEVLEFIITFRSLWESCCQQRTWNVFSYIILISHINMIRVFKILYFASYSCNIFAFSCKSPWLNSNLEKQMNRNTSSHLLLKAYQYLSHLYSQKTQHLYKLILHIKHILPKQFICKYYITS